MIDFVIHDSAGRITETGKVIEAILDMQANPEKGEFLAIGKGDLDRNWVQDGRIVDRPALDYRLSARSAPADGTSVVTLSGVPAGASIDILGPAGASGAASGADIELTFALPGRYTILIKLFPYLDVKETVDAL